MNYKLNEKKYFEKGNKEEFFESVKKIDNDLIVPLNELLNNIEKNGYLNFVDFIPHIENNKECLMTLVLESEMNFENLEKIIQDEEKYNDGWCIKIFKNQENKIEFLQFFLDSFVYSKEKKDFILFENKNEEKVSVIIEIKNFPNIYFLINDKKEKVNFQDDYLILYLSYMLLHYFAQKSEFYNKIYNEIKELKNKGINEITIFKLYNFEFLSNKINSQKEYFEILKKENKIDLFSSKFLEKYSKELPFLLNYMLFSNKLEETEKENEKLVKYYEKRYFIVENIFKDLIENKEDFFNFVVKYHEKEKYFCSSLNFLTLYIYSKLFGYSLENVKLEKRIDKIDHFLFNIFFDD